MESKGATLFLGGISRLPKELAMGETLQVIVELDPDKGEVLDVSWEPCPSMIEKFLMELMIGKHLEAGINDLKEPVQQRLHLKIKKAILAALNDLSRTYQEYRNNGVNPIRS